MQTLTHTQPTGALYGVHANQETRAEVLPAIDVENLIGALGRDPIGHTDVTPIHLRLPGPGSELGLDVVAYTGGGHVFVAEIKVFDPTPSTIEQSRGWVVPVDPAASDPPAYEAFKALGRWLNADDAAIADMVGVGRTTPYTWKRDSREPGPPRRNRSTSTTQPSTRFVASSASAVCAAGCMRVSPHAATSS